MECNLKSLSRCVGYVHASTKAFAVRNDRDYRRDIKKSLTRIVDQLEDLIRLCDDVVADS